MKKQGILVGFLAAACLLCSCDRADVRDELAQKDARIAELGQQLRDMEQKHSLELENKFSDLTQEYNRHIDVLRKDFETRSEKYDVIVENLKHAVGEKDKEIAKLKSSVSRAENTARNWEDRYRVEKEKKVAAIANPPLLDPEDIQKTAKAEKELFPIEVFDIAGKKIIIGRHMVAEYVETDETYRDSFGKVQKVKKRQQVPREEYGYEVRFSIRNKTKEEKDVSVRAGALTRVIGIPAGGVVPDQSVTSAMGAPLTVMVGGFSKSFDVSYE